MTLSDKRDLSAIVPWGKPIFHLFFCFDEGPNAIFCTSDHISEWQENIHQDTKLHFSLSVHVKLQDHRSSRLDGSWKDLLDTWYRVYAMNCSSETRLFDFSGYLCVLHLIYRMEAWQLSLKLLHKPWYFIHFAFVEKNICVKHN